VATTSRLSEWWGLVCVIILRLRTILIPLSIIVVGANLANNPLHTAIYDSPCAVANTSRLDKCWGAPDLCKKRRRFLFVCVFVREKVAEACTLVRAWLCVYVWICVRLCLHLRLYMCVLACARVCVCVCVCACTCVCVTTAQAESMRELQEEATAIKGYCRRAQVKKTLSKHTNWREWTSDIFFHCCVCVEDCVCVFVCLCVCL